jgi:arylsulfatase A-like enzyme
MNGPPAHPSGPGRLSLMLTSPIAIGAACTLDLALSPSQPERVTAAVVACLVLALGILHGALFEAAFALASRVSAGVAFGAWLLLSVGAALWLASSLGAFQNLGGRYHMLAVGTLVACGLGGPGLAALMVLFGGARGRPRGFLVTLPLRLRLASSLGLLALATAAFVADRLVLVGLYPHAHLALRLAFVWLCAPGLALLAWPRAPLWPRPDAWHASTAIALFACALGLGDRAGDDLATLGLRAWPRLLLETGRTLTDLDLDGHSHLLGGGDCGWLDRSINPEAREVAGNGVDDNCLLGDGKREAVKRQRLDSPDDPSPVDVVLITIDSLQRDRLGAYSKRHRADGLATSPNLDAFAASSLVFERAYTSGGWTSIAISSLMRGVLARRIQWTRMYETTKYRFVRKRDRRKLPEGEQVARMFPMPVQDPHPSIAEWLSQRGMHTLAVVDDGYVQVLAPYVGIAPGFELYQVVDLAPNPKLRGDKGVAQLAIDALAAVPAGERVFLWAHFFGPHVPSKRHKSIRHDGDTIDQQYEHEIRFMDHHLGKLLDAIEQRKQPTAVFVTADHGEEIVTGGRHHGWSLSDDVLRIPLIARVPGWPKGQSSIPVSLVDLMPTILKLTETPLPQGLDGIAIDELMSSSSRALSRFVFADTWQYDRSGSLWKSEVAAIDWRSKATYEPTRSAWTLYDLEKRPPRRRSASRRTKAVVVQALADYVESADGTTRLRD